MKKIRLIVLLAIVSATLLYAQEKGSHLSFSVGGGLTGINYELLKNSTRDGERNNQLGATAVIDYTYYFNQHWGVSLGAGASYYRSKGMYPGVYNEDYFILGTQFDNDYLYGQNEYELRVRLMNWEEQQQILLVDIPLMLKYQHKLGARKRHGIFWGVGAKLQIPVVSKYSVTDGNFSDLTNENNWRLNVSAYYSDKNLEVGQLSTQPGHNLGTITDPNASLGWKGDINLKLSWAAVGEVGVLFGLSKRTDLSVGIYGDYGFNNIKRESKPLIEAPENYMENSNGKIGEGITYNGMLNSDRVNKINLFSVGLKVGVKVKLGKLTAKDHFLDKADEFEKLPFITQDTCCGSTDTQKMENTLERIETLIRNLQKNDSITRLQMIDDGLIEPERIKLTERVHFDLGDWKIRKEDIPILDKKVAILKEHPHLRIRILGNTCDIASDQINIPLGFNRAKTVKDYMVKQGISAYRIVVATQSSYDPVLPNTNEENRIQNRRCDFEIIID